MANSVDPDQMPCSAVSDLGLSVCKGLSVPKLRVIMVNWDFIFPPRIRYVSCPQSNVFIATACISRVDRKTVARQMVIFPNTYM